MAETTEAEPKDESMALDTLVLLGSATVVDGGCDAMSVVAEDCPIPVAASVDVAISVVEDGGIAESLDKGGDGCATEVSDDEEGSDGLRVELEVGVGLAAESDRGVGD